MLRKLWKSYWEVSMPRELWKLDWKRRDARKPSWKLRDLGGSVL